MNKIAAKKNKIRLTSLVGLMLVILTGLLMYPFVRDLPPTSENAKPEMTFIGPVDPTPESPNINLSVEATAVQAVTRSLPATYRTVGEHLELTAEVPGPAGPSPYGRGKGYYFDPNDPVQPDSNPERTIIQPEASPQSTAPAVDTSFDSINFDDNGTETGGFRSIPPDPHAAAGEQHLVNVANVSIRFHQKDGSLIYSDSLKDFFAPLSPINFTFDPKVIYDQFNDRFVVVTLEYIDNGGCSTDSNCTSRLLVAVSDDGDPTGSWYMTSIDAEVKIDGNDYWFDYPGLAVDEEAIYISGNMFKYPSIGGSYGGVRLWVIAKGNGSGGFYDGGAAIFSDYNPYEGGIPGGTSIPAHVFGSMPNPIGTYLVAFGGGYDGMDEYLRVIRVENPLTTPSFILQYVNVGNIEAKPKSDLPDAPQLGSNTTIEVNSRRVLDVDWRNNTLYLTSTIVPGTGEDAGETTAHWWALDTTTPDSLQVSDQGNIGGEDIAEGTYTFFPSLAVNNNDDIVIGYTASGAGIYPGAYYTSRLRTDSAGTNSGSGTLRAGIDWYYRTFGGSRNRWGDYIGAAVDPHTQCTWVYNVFAMARGSTDSRGEDGRWSTAYGEICLCPYELNINTENFWFGDYSRLAENNITVTGDTEVKAGVGLSLEANSDISFGSGFKVVTGGTLSVVTGNTPCIASPEPCPEPCTL